METGIVEAIKELLSEELKNNRINLIIILGVGLFLYIVSNLLIPYILNVLDRKNEIKRLKIERKINDIEILFDRLKAIQTISVSKDSEGLKEEIDDARAFVNKKSYRFPNQMKSSINSFFDYYSECLVSPEKKDPEKESDFFDRIYKEYDKLS